MRTAGADLPLYQYLLLDVIAAILTIIFIVIYIMYFLIRTLLSVIRGRAQAASQEKKQQ